MDGKDLQKLVKHLLLLGDHAGLKELIAKKKKRTG